MKTRLLAEMIYSAVVYGQGTKRQIIDKIASMLEADRTARMEAAEAVETLAHAAMSGYAMPPARVSELVELVRNSYKLCTLPPEPRTCETCGGKLTDCGPGQACEHWTPRSPQSADVEMVREVINKVTLWISSIICQCETGDRETPDHVCDRCVILAQLKCSLAALDRIAGVLRG